MEEHRPDKGRHQNRRPTPGQAGRDQRKTDYLRHRQGRTRPAIRYRLLQTQKRTRMGTDTPVRRRHRKNRPLVPR